MKDLKLDDKKLWLRIKKVPNPSNPNVYFKDDNLFLVYDHEQLQVKKRTLEKDSFLDITANEVAFSLTNDSIGIDFPFKAGFYIIDVYITKVNHKYILSADPARLINDTWNTVMRGYILCRRKIDKHDVTLEQAQRWTEDLLGTWNNYLDGHVYEGEIIKKDICPHCGNIHEEALEESTPYYQTLTLDLINEIAHDMEVAFENPVSLDDVI